MKRITIIIFAVALGLAFGGFSDGGAGDRAEAAVVAEAQSPEDYFSNRTALIALNPDMTTTGAGIDNFDDNGGGGIVYICWEMCDQPYGMWGICWDPRCGQRHAAQCVYHFSHIFTYWVPRI